MPPKGKGKATYERVILRGAGQLSAAEVEEFHRYMEEHNNTFTNSQGQSITFDQATVT